MKNINLNKTSGQGDDTLKMYAINPNNGRNAKVDGYTVFGENYNHAEGYIVEHEGRPEFIEAGNITIDEDEDVITIKGTSNSPNIAVAVDASWLTVEGGTVKVTVLGKEYGSGENINGDPGGDDIYEFTVTIPIKDREPGNQTGDITLSGDDTDKTITVSQTGEDLFFYLGGKQLEYLLVKNGDKFLSK